MNYLFYLRYFTLINIFQEIEGFASMSYLEFTPHNITGVIKLELKIVKHELIRLQEKVLVDLRPMQVDGPPYPQLDLPTALAVFVNADLLPVDQLAVVK